MRAITRLLLFIVMSIFSGCNSYWGITKAGQNIYLAGSTSFLRHVFTLGDEMRGKRQKAPYLSKTEC